MVLNDAGGWLNGDAVVGWLAVVAAGVAVGVGLGVGGGGGGVVSRAGAAGLAVRTRGRGGAVTVTVGTVTLGVVCGAACGAVCGASGVVCGVCGAGDSDAGGVVVGGVSDGVGGVCDEAPPATQSATSAELLRRSKRLLEIDMTPPYRPKQRTVTEHQHITAKQNRAGRRRGRRWREACRHPIDVRRREVRARRTARVVGRGSQMRAAARLASGRKCAAAARMAARQGPKRWRDGLGYRSNSGRRLDGPDLRDPRA